MRTYTTLRNTTAALCNVSTSDTAKMTKIDQYNNDSIRTMCNLQGGKLRFLESTSDMYTVASQETYQIPNKYRKLIDLWIYSDSNASGATSRSTVYSPEMVFDPVKWKQILQYRFGTQDVPYFTYVERTTFKIQPIPSTSGRKITLRGRLLTKDLTIADYTTGTITTVPYTTTFTAIVASGATTATLSSTWGLATGSYLIAFSNNETRPVTLTNGSAAVTWTTALTSAATASITVNAANGGSLIVASGTAFTADMVDRYIQITETTAANGGDGFWYQIGYYYSATQIGLYKPYEGTAISAGSAAFTIGQCSVIPEAYDIGICYRSAAIYWQNQNDLVRAKTYWLQYDGGNEAGYSNVYGGLVGQMLSNEGETEEGAYLPPFATTVNTPQAPYYFPYQDASGF